jgi:hypothetical protein
LITLPDTGRTTEKLKSLKETCTDYLIMLNILKSKISFGKEESHLQVEFTWKSFITNTNQTSNNINFEYYSVLFNLGVINTLLARQLLNSDDDSKIKEGIKYFQNAAWVFEKVKSEVTNSIPLKELPLDLSPNYLSYVNFFDFSLHT